MALPNYGTRNNFFGIPLPLGGTSTERGASEWVADKLGFARNDQGGSNIWGGARASSGQVAGAQDQAPSQYTYDISNATTLRGNSPGGGFGNLTNTGGQPSPQPLPQTPQQNFTRPNADNAYGDYLSKLDELAGLLPGQAQGQRDFIGQQFDIQSQGISDAEAANLAKIDTSRNEATQRKAVTLRDVASDLTNALQAGNVFLGNLGASDSSATGRLGGALAKSANRRRTDVLNQFNDAMGQLDQKELEVQQVAQDQLRELQTWKSSALQQVQDWLNQQQSQIAGMRTEDARQVWNEARQTALNQLAQIDSQSASFMSGLQEWALSRSENINQLKTNLNQISQFQQPNYTYDAFANPQTATGSDSGAVDVGYGSSLEDQQQTTLGSGLTTANVNPVGNNVPLQLNPDLLAGLRF